MANPTYIRNLNPIPNYNLGLLRVDVDPAAEFIMVYNRRDFSLLGAKSNVESNNLRFKIPVEFTTTNNLLVVMLDMDLTYNAVVLDGVKAELIDGNIKI
ncbi:hypothetical protein NVP1049O_23 [Vibrio phage 1.049.O._10N.286.54.B5]|nr:hypothetical protein NVP1049O_23 [Vibrio phage 1.049.O._10N.286.54.B5]AUR84192.1 hypothetical protein NVP1050O_23 [Vibrio phage 1.050.O._10N.286.48.A6]